MEPPTGSRYQLPTHSGPDRPQVRPMRSLPKSFSFLRRVASNRTHLPIPGVPIPTPHGMLCMSMTVPGTGSTRGTLLNRQAVPVARVSATYLQARPLCRDRPCGGSGPGIPTATASGATACPLLYLQVRLHSNIPRAPSIRACQATNGTQYLVPHGTGSTWMTVRETESVPGTPQSRQVVPPAPGLAAYLPVLPSHRVQPYGGSKLMDQTAMVPGVMACRSAYRLAKLPCCLPREPSTPPHPTIRGTQCLVPRGTGSM